MNALAQAIVEKRLKCQAHADGNIYRWHNRFLIIKQLFINKLQIGYEVYDQGSPDVNLFYDIVHNIIYVGNYDIKNWEL